MNKILCLLTILTLTTCIGGEKDTEKVSSNKKFVRVATNIRENTFSSDSLVKFFELINQKTGDKFQFQIFYNGQLGEQKETFELIRVDALDMTWINSAVIESAIPEFGAFNLPYFLVSDKQVEQAYSSDKLNNFLTELAAPFDVVPLALFDNTSRSFLGRKPYLTPADLKGEKIRIQQSPIYVDIVQRLGGNPIPISFSEVFTALQQKVVDGAEGGQGTMASQRYGEVVKHYTYTYTTRPVNVLLSSKTFYNSLTEEEKKAIVEARNEVITNFHYQNFLKSEAKLIEDAKDLGVQYHETDIEPFRKILAPMLTEWAENDQKRKELLEIVASFEDKNQ